MLNRESIQEYIIKFYIEFRNKISKDIIPRELMVETLPGRATIIAGPRRVGKTYYLFSLIDPNIPERYLYINFTHPIFHSMSPEDFADILYTHRELYPKIKKPIILLDEVEEIPKWENIVLDLLNNGYIVYITSSSRKINMHLTGQSIIYTLFPLSFGEFLRFKGFEYRESESYKDKLDSLLSEYLRFGGYPEVVLAPRENMKKRILENYVNSIIMGDVQRMQDIEYIDLFKAIFELLLSRYSNLVTYNKLQHEIKYEFNISKSTLISYLRRLEDLFLVFLLPKYSQSSRELHKAPKKVYLIDTGLALFSMRKKESIDMENVVFLELMRRYSQKPSINIAYWNDERGRMVDFVISENKKVRELIQVTYSLDNERELLTLLHASKNLNCKDLTVITRKEEGIEEISINETDKQIVVVPLGDWLIKSKAYIKEILLITKKVRMFEKKYGMDFENFERQLHTLKQESFEMWDDYIEWKAYIEMLDTISKEHRFDKNLREIKNVRRLQSN